MTQQHGRRYEHTLAQSLDESTWDNVWVTTAGYSGNSAVDACDLVVTVSPKLATRSEEVQYNIEAKKRQGEAGKRTIVFGGSSDETGVEEVERLIVGTPNWGRPLIALKWDHRQLFVTDARSVLVECEDYEGEYEPVVRKSSLAGMEPRITGSGSISMIKPDTTSWPSAQAGIEDGKYLADELELR